MNAFILEYINDLMIQLLDYCVKNCGYPFQLIISTKDFLNELVKKFPETPIVSIKYIIPFMTIL